MHPNGSMEFRDLESVFPELKEYLLPSQLLSCVVFSYELFRTQCLRVQHIFFTHLFISIKIIFPCRPDLLLR